MTYEYEEEIKAEFSFEHKELYKKIVDTVLEIEKCPYETWVSLLITDNEGIHMINKDNRDVDAPTDVLSFPMVEYSVPADFSDVENSDDNFDPDTGELLLGDIILSYDKILEQAELYGHSIQREYSFLIVHSMLHLIGYDHMIESDRILMEERQKIIMDALNISR